MGKNSTEILAYITSDEHRVKTRNPLTLVIEDENERKSCVTDIARALKANVLQMKNGDYVIISGA
jgi:aspartate 1-decarboxylase